MRILLISAEFPPDVGGVGDYTRRLALALVERGHAVAVLTSRYGLIEYRANHATTGGVSRGADETAKLETRNSKLETRNPKPETRNPKLETWSIKPYTTAIDSFKPDVIHLQYQTGAYGMHPAVLLLPARLRKLRRAIPVVVTAHDLRLPYLFPKADLLRDRLTGRLFGDAAAVIVTNMDDARRLDGLYPPSRELYSPRRRLQRQHIPIGSNIEPAMPVEYDRVAQRATLGAGADSILVGYFGLLSRTKGVVELLDTLRGLPPRFRLLVVGGAAPLPDDRSYALEVEAAIAEHGLGKRVIITGPLPAHAVSAHLLACDIAALPFADGATYRRGSLLAVLAHGLPTITTLPRAPLEPPLRDGNRALLVPAGDTEALAAAVLRLAGDAQLRETLSRGALELAAHFSWPNIAQRHENVYHSLVNNAPG